ncbi:Asp/Glu/hydantoin racemase [Anseongella ginsenosidimutans]|uniref:Asp/Glu/hydantoin racemase n=1 Tax=Anseongella ginsenosidimutans TaxID=496056 RepID=A0A4R3KXM1_9SPHI|nr:aspartate/glutamate racemase family protein [Anseongella ginsenosidimutans]QEC51836.1 Asp/Glu/hydantoin racemase [Anseongella ginsenosidimutans]TCS89210.1 Asp/Glu/hydantoin racemase [Anseongella ginsenosidimutans]
MVSSRFNIRISRFVFALLLGGCSQGPANETGNAGLRPIEQAILTDEQSFYYIDFDKYPSGNPELPIGIFDSGTGGLTVLDALLRFDGHHNGNHSKGSDSRADFGGEKFIYLADQANMPYGNYHSENKSGLLVEHVLKDVQFLLGSKYYLNENAAGPENSKQPVKALVIACNTATAYAKEDVENFIARTGTNLKVIGVIDAGAEGALEVFGKDSSGTIGVLATVGTVASGGYQHTIERFIKELGYTGNIRVISQGGLGMAEAVDEETDYVNRYLSGPRENYRGPSFSHSEYKIEKALLDVYNFEYDDHRMLCDPGNTGDCELLQINSADNYMRYHLVSLMEKLRNTPRAAPLKALVLGCTHYPYLTNTIREVLDELYNYRQNGGYRYRALMAENIRIIDPAENVARELYEYLAGEKLFNPGGSAAASEFYISVPNKGNQEVKTDSLGRFTYAYKYGREEGRVQEYVKIVPFSRTNIPSETIERLKAIVPAVYELIGPFRNSAHPVH